MKPEVDKIVKKIASLNHKLSILQSKCPHENVDAKYGGSSGHFDPMDNSYWVEVKCLDCGMRMIFDSERDKNEYDYYGRKVKPK